MYAVEGRFVLMLKIDTSNYLHSCSTPNILRYYLRNIVVSTSITVTFKDIKPSKKNSLK